MVEKSRASEVFELVIICHILAVHTARKAGFDLQRARRDDLLILLHAFDHQETMRVLDNQTKILNDIRELLVKVTTVEAYSGALNS